MTDWPVTWRRLSSLFSPSSSLLVERQVWRRGHSLALNILLRQRLFEKRFQEKGHDDRSFLFRSQNGVESMRYSTASLKFIPFIGALACSTITTVVPSLRFSFFASAMSTTNTKVIDSHLHVWANTKESTTGFPYAEGQEPPASLSEVASTTSLLEKMNANGVDGSLIVQPINHKFDHSYVTKAISDHPDRFKGMMLHDPSQSPQDAVSTLEDLALKGYVGVRFNPYLWTKTGETSWTPMSTPNGSGLAVYKRCAELHMPVGVMCFQGLQLHYDDIVALLKASPETTLVLDHFGFTGFNPEGESAFEKLLALAEYPQVVVKISALFRLGDSSPYERVRKERFDPLLKAFGAERLMFGTDFPFVVEQEPERYEGMVKLVASWTEKEEDKTALMGRTAERLFGPWGTPTTAS